MWLLLRDSFPFFTAGFAKCKQGLGSGLGGGAGAPGGAAGSALASSFACRLGSCLHRHKFLCSFLISGWRTAVSV